MSASSLVGPLLLQGQESPNAKVVIGVMGCNGRGLAHVEGFSGLPNVEIGYICDVDARAVEKGLAAVSKRQARTARGVTDFRQILADDEVDVLTIAAPNHWHAPAAILACQAGKHVYVEKPGSHNPQEGEWMVAVARRHGRVVQLGTQRRSWPGIREAMERLHAGEIGKVCFARTWYNNLRPSIGRGKEAPLPEGLQYDLWQGPAPRRPYRDNVVHYNWHWFWHWGNGELGNNGIHALDLARWGLQADLPLRVTCGGNRYHFQDDQESPDIYVTTYDFGDKGATWESHSCDPHGFHGTGFGVQFYGDRGSLVIAGNAVTVYDLKQKVVRETPGRGSDGDHFRNFLGAVRKEQKLTAEIEEGQKSTLLCHLGNIAYRSGGSITLDPKTRRIVENAEGARLWGREYATGWEPKVG